MGEKRVHLVISVNKKAVNMNYTNYLLTGNERTKQETEKKTDQMKKATDKE